MKITAPVFVTCKKCKTINEIPSTDFGEPETSSEERSMGTEYAAYWHHEISCNKCSNHLIIEISSYEYPYGFLNLVLYECSGGVIKEQPSVEIEYDE